MVVRKKNKTSILNSIQDSISAAVEQNQDLKNSADQITMTIQDQTINVDCITAINCDVKIENKANLNFTAIAKITQKTVGSIKNDIQEAVKTTVYNTIKQYSFSSFSDLADEFGSLSNNADLANKIAEAITNSVVSNQDFANINKQLSESKVNQVINLGGALSPGQKPTKEQAKKYLNTAVPEYCRDCPEYSVIETITKPDGTIINKKSTYPACFLCLGTPENPRVLNALNYSSITMIANYYVNSFINAITENKEVVNITNKLQNDIEQTQGGSLQGISHAMGPALIVMIIGGVLLGAGGLYISYKKLSKKSDAKSVPKPSSGRDLPSPTALPLD